MEDFEKQVLESLKQIQGEQKTTSEKLVKVETTVELQNQRTREEMQHLWKDRNALSDDVAVLKTEIRNHKEDHPSIKRVYLTNGAISTILSSIAGWLGGIFTKGG